MPRDVKKLNFLKYFNFARRYSHLKMFPPPYAGMAWGIVIHIHPQAARTFVHIVPVF